MTHCPCCQSSDFEPVVSLPNMPVVINALSDDAASARAVPRGDVELVVCRSCGLVYNAVFDDARMAYVPDYENALHHSPSFKVFADGLVSDLVQAHDLYGKRVVEVGCGDGFVLSRFLDAGVGEAIGFDPSMEGRDSPFARPNMRIVPHYFSTDEVDGPIDAVVCRHVLEHLAEPRKLLSDLRRQIGDRDMVVYIEVPNAEWMLQTVSVWDVIYEHVSYWTQPAIEMLLRRTGFQPYRIRQGYSGQFIMVEARPADVDPDYVSNGVDEALRRARSFGSEAALRIADWRTRLKDRCGRAVLWGAGSKGVTFANALGDCGGVVAMVDLNPRKHGRCASGAAIPIVHPDKLSEIQPDLVLVSNGLYEAEIRDRLASLGLAPELWVITGNPGPAQGSVGRA
ncbi:methyltransferase [Acuticoccus sediminis]|uniref:Methyltransferase n=1 Tax=Acuticoccus sediminis TaxID=2184697 RepID=A0A8B2NH34_9HYPH|nr:class I SAM-dependent methyltransferase [Acuticoccus sediminis]RAH98791.1 methyltransferase [Acuticoccus sediminis]